MKITVELRKDHVDKQGRHSIRVRGEDNDGAGQVRLSTGLNIEEKHWDERGERVRPSYPAHAAMNDKIKRVCLAVEEALIRGEKDVKAYVRTKSAGNKLHEQWRAWYELHKGRYAEVTRTAIKARIDNVKAFDPLITVEGVDRTWMISYANWQRDEGYKTNTIYDRCKRVRNIVDALRAQLGLPELRELRRLGVYEEDTGWKRLTFDQFTMVEKWKPPKYSRFQRSANGGEEMRWRRLARHLWLFSLYTGGTRFGDLVRVQRSWIKGKTMEHRAAKPPYKARVIPLIPEALAILKLYPGEHLWNPIVPVRKGSIRIKGNALLNRYIKQVCRESGIPEEIAKHVSINWARHSAADFLWAKGVDPRTIAMILGNTPAVVEKHYLSKENTERSGAALRKAFRKKR